MVRLRCHIGKTTGMELPSALVSDGFNYIREFFANQTSGNLILDIDTSHLRSNVQTIMRDKISAYELHRAVRLLTRNRLEKKRVDNIALIFGSTYLGNESAFGMMFDEGYVYDGDPADNVDAPELLGPAREGCAVFVNAIRHYREPSIQNSEIRFTSLHELGHVFNLQHRDHCENIMVPSARYGPVSEENWVLVENDSYELSQNPLTDRNHPGGSSFDAGYVPNVAQNWSYQASMRYAHAQMKVGVSINETHAFESIELDVTLKTIRPYDKNIRISDRIDPGYDEFRIWIEEPNGARRTLVSPRHYCSPVKWITLGPGTSWFQRDISIHRQAGGRVFRKSGNHKVWTELNLGKRGFIRSNKVDLRIKSRNEMTEADREACCLLTKPAGIVLGYSRVWCRQTRDFRRSIVDLIQRYPDRSWASNLRYCTLRADELERTSDGEGFIAYSEPEFRELAEQAANDSRLGSYRRRKVRGFALN